MRKTVTILIVLAALAGMPLFGQTVSEKNQSEFYYVNVPLEKVYPSSRGYILQYRSGVNALSTVAIPNEWFTFSGGKAELIKLPKGKNWPTLSVFYKKGGEFSHVRLYIHPSKAHTTWGNIPLGTNLDTFFTDNDTIDIKY